MCCFISSRISACSREKRPDREIAEARFFPLDGLPENTTPATRRRLAELFEGAAVSEYW